MSSETPCRREWLAFAAIVAATLSLLALRLPGTLAEARELSAAIERDGTAATCGHTLPGSGELAAALTALEAFQGRDAGLRCAPA